MITADNVSYHALIAIKRDNGAVIAAHVVIDNARRVSVIVISAIWLLAGVVVLDRQNLKSDRIVLPVVPRDFPPLAAGTSSEVPHGA